MSSYVFGFRAIDNTNSALVGGKGANLHALSSIEGIHVPDGFCVSTDAYRRILEHTPSIDALLDQLAALGAGQRDAIGALSGTIRGMIEATPIPDPIAAAVRGMIAELGDQHAYAVRSSATAEDLPSASFAGQQDTFLNVIGADAILLHISKCWASLFTERAVTYRIQNGFDHRKVRLAVVVQRMIVPEAAGIMFTADPITGNRTVVSIDASFGLGEALVSGLVNADVYKVRDGAITDKQIGTKKLAIRARPDGGTTEQEIAVTEQQRPTLTDNEIVELAGIGRTIEQHFGRPQDIEWCLHDGTFWVVQSRPITTLFPVPQVNDGEKHVFISVGHQQMMTDPIRPLGLSFYRLTSPRPMYVAGGRLFVDVTAELNTAVGRNVLVNVLGENDPLIRDALLTLIERGDIVKPLPEATTETPAAPPPANFEVQIAYDPNIVATLTQQGQASLEALKHAIQSVSGVDVFDFILDDVPVMRAFMADPRGFNVFMTGMNASGWLNEKIEAWLGDKNVADTLAQSIPNNVTSEMGLKLLDVADEIRPYPEVIAYLEQVADDSTLDGMIALPGGQRAYDAIYGFLAAFGMRCAGEIDITRTRWSERPATLVPLILGNIKFLEPGMSARKFEQGRQEAESKRAEILHRLRQLPDGERKAAETDKMITLVRGYSGYREYPKYFMVNRYFAYKQALMREADRLVEANVIEDREDVYYLSFEEFCEAVRTQHVDPEMIAERKDDYRTFAKLTPSRVTTSDGEIIVGQYKRENLPPNAIVGLPVSSGVIEGRARVILNMEDANLQDGDILVTVFTDPSWTPLFVAIKGLVTEVGGLMTHGAVIAREYGLPAVVGVDHATTLIRDGQRIRVHGTEGYIEIL